MEFKFKVGDKVRRDRKIWKENKPGYFGEIVSLAVSQDNSGRKKPGYHVKWNRSESVPSIFLEQELELQKTRRKK